MRNAPTAVFIGQSPIDVVVRVTDEFLNEHGIVKHTTRVIDRFEKDSLLTSLTNRANRFPGGGAANTACAFSSLNGKAIFNGKYADDDDGRLFSSSLEQAGVTLPSSAFNSRSGSDLIFTFITPDNERSFAACYEITSSFHLEELDTACLQDADLLFLEGFLLNVEGGFTALSKAATLTQGHKAGKPDLPESVKREERPFISFSPCDPQVIQLHRHQIEDLLGRVDILIMNEHEAASLYPGRSLDEISDLCRERFYAGAITLGEKGAIGFLDKRKHFSPAPPVPLSKIVNTTGAGDAFAGGFLYALMSGYDLKSALFSGHDRARAVIQKPGAR